MRSRFLGVTASVLALATLGAVAFGADATPPSSADIVRGTGCVFFDATGAPFEDPGAAFQVVSTGNARGNTTVTCHGSLPAGAELPTRAMHWDFGNTGFTCLEEGDWNGVTTPSGQASFTCRAPE